MKPSIKVTLIMLLLLAIILGGLYWYSYHFGVKKDIDRTLDAVAILEDGTDLPCTVRIQGTIYIGHPEAELDQFDGSICVNDYTLPPSYVFTAVDSDIIKCGRYYTNRDMSIFAAEVDAANIFPDMESQTAYVILKSSTPEEYEPILDMLRAD